jgi:hypothetical protein
VKKIPTCLHGRFGLGFMKELHPPLIILLGYGSGPENDVLGLILQFFTTSSTRRFFDLYVQYCYNLVWCPGLLS